MMVIGQSMIHIHKPQRTSEKYLLKEYIISMKKIWLFLGGGVLVVFIAAIVLFFVVNNQFKPDKTVDSFNQAVKDEDLETLEKLIEPDDENLEIDKHS